jgi:hypothetical protein
MDEINSGRIDLKDFAVVAEIGPDGITIHNPTDHPVTVDVTIAHCLKHTLGKVNAECFLGFAPGTLVAGKCWLDNETGKAQYDFLYKPNDWNDVPALDGNQYRIVDFAGRSLFESAIFPAEGIEYTVTDSVTGEQLYPPVEPDVVIE